MTHVTTDEEREILHVLQGFFSTMCQWKKGCVTSRAQNSIKARLQAYAQLEAIFNRFCTKKERKKERGSALHFACPSEYSADNQVIKQMEINSQQAFFYTEQQQGLQNRYRFCLCRQEASWKIESQECFYPADEQYHALFNSCFAWKSQCATEQEEKAMHYA